MDPIAAFSALSAVLSVVDIALRTTSELITYAKDTKHASTERKLLVVEAQHLSKLLRRLKDRAKATSSDKNWLGDRRDLVNHFQKAYDDLAVALKVDTSTGQLIQESRLKTMRTIIKWSYTKSEVYSLLERIARLQQHVTTLLLDDQYIVVERLEKTQQEAFDQKLKADITSWLSPLQMNQIHQTIASQPEKGSGDWFLSSDEFHRWRIGEKKFLWCSGIPGAGKTVLASIIFDHLRREQDEQNIDNSIGIAILYLRYKDPEQNLNSLLGSLLRQFTEEHESVPVPIHFLYESYRNHNSPPSSSEVVKTLLAMVEIYKENFLVIDALDECDDRVRWGLIEILLKLQPKIHLLITSRFLESIAEELEGFERVVIKANKKDIELFVDHQISMNRNLKNMVERSALMRADIKEVVVKRADNMFLLARLHVESLTSAAALTIKHVRTKLQTLPTTLEETYDEAMRRIENLDSDRRNVALKTLAWISYSFRSLTIKELQHALAIEPGDFYLDEELIMDGQSITALCAGLVIVDPRNNVVNFVHYTTEDYFVKIRFDRFPGFHASITISCATYLNLDELKGANIWNIVQNYPLACYAAQYMGDHARQHPEDALELSTLDTICLLLSHPDKRKPLLSLLDGLDLIKSGYYSSASLEIDSANKGSDFGGEIAAGGVTTMKRLSNERPSLYQMKDNDINSWETRLRSSRIPEVTALHLAASMGLAKVASMLLKESPDIDAKDETGKTALSVAMERGFEKAVEFLVDSGANVDLWNEHGRGVLLLIAERDWHKVGEVIVHRTKEKVKKYGSRVGQGQVQLLLAAYSGDCKEIQRLVNEDDFNLRNKDSSIGATALFVAVERGYLEAVQILLSAGVGVDSTDNAGQTSLHRSTRRGNEKLIKALLQHGATVDFKDDEGRTAWSANAASQNEPILRVLLGAGADPNTKANHGVTELYAAAAAGNLDYVRFLLKSGTDPSIRTRFNWAPLHWASSNGHFDCVKMLLEAGADPSPISDQNTTPLDLALKENHLLTADLLRSVGAMQKLNDSQRPIGLEPSLSLEPSRREGKDYDVRDPHWPSAEDDEPSSSKMYLIFDEVLYQRLLFGQFMYSRNHTSEGKRYYQISHPLSSPITSLSIRRTQKFAAAADYPLGPEDFNSNDVLYEITRVTPDFQEIRLQAKSQSGHSTSREMLKEWTGGWKVHEFHKDRSTFLFRGTPDWSNREGKGFRWTTEDGNFLARAGWDGATPTLCFGEGTDPKTWDTLVACWVAQLWSEHSAPIDP